jgi:hypothetical protein
MGRKGRCEQLGAQVKHFLLYGSQKQKSLKSLIARGQNTELVSRAALQNILVEGEQKLALLN